MRHLRAASVLLLAVGLLSGQYGRRKLWDLDLSIFANHAKDATALVWGIRFSPDESSMAIGYGPSGDTNPRPQHIVVVAVAKPQTAIRDFDLSPSRVSRISGTSIVWSPSGAIIVARTPTPVMFRLGPEPPCLFPKESEFGGFLSGDKMLLFLGQLDKPSQLQILNSDCSVADTWKADGWLHVFDTSSEQDLFATETSLDHAHSAIKLVSSSTHQVTQRWSSEAEFLGTWDGFLFCDKGRLLCGSDHLAGKPLPVPSCWDTHTGVRIAESPKVGLGPNAIESEGGELLGITDFKHVSLPFQTLLEWLDSPVSYSAPRRRLIWNIRTGNEVASWGVAGLQQKELIARPKDIIKRKFVLSLSATGKYMAEGGSASVSVYTVQQ